VKATRQARAEAGREGGLRSGEARRKQAEKEEEANGKQAPSKTEAKEKTKTDSRSRSRSRSESPSPKEETPSAATAPTSEPKSKRKSPKAKKPPTPEAVKVFRENAHRYPPKAWYDDIVEAVGEESADLELWGQVVKAYIGLGWNPGNVKNMLAYYEKREIPATKGQQNKGNASSAPDEWLARRQEAGLGGPS
jgi:DNA mismatch repair ATPase MutL